MVRWWIAGGAAFLLLVVVFLVWWKVEVPKGVSHELKVMLNPERHEIIAWDTIRLNGEPSFDRSVRLTLNQALIVDEIRSGHEQLPFKDLVAMEEQKGAVAQRGSPVRIIEVQVGHRSDTEPSNELTVAYHGTIHDPPRASRGLRFVRPDKTNGHIGPEGVYLTSETAWYPDISGSLATFRVQITVPEGWYAVTQGKEVSRTVEKSTVIAQWDVEMKSEALTLVANRFVKNQKDWQGIELATYLYQEDAHLAPQYLEATIKYLEVYTRLLGPYPFRKFAVVENFFPSGIGLPSFTLLGSRVIKRGYTQPYSLGHEIVHSWMGNSVYNDLHQGNWVEGLTTYLANYYFEELSEGVEKALVNRQRMFFEYSLYATPDHDYPLVEFHHKETRIDNAIGYQKAAMVFHMLRREIGHEAFFEGLRALVATRTGRYAEWQDLQEVFEQSAGRSLGWFFSQWIERPGAPQLILRDSKVQEDPDAPGGFIVRANIVQEDGPFRIQLPVFVDLEGGQVHKASIKLEENVQDIALRISARPVRLTIDPEFETFRRLSREQVPPMLNVWATDPTRSVFHSKTLSKEYRDIFAPTLRRIRAQGEGVQEHTDPAWEVGQESVLVFTEPKQLEIASVAAKSCEGNLSLEEEGVGIMGKKFEGPEIAVIVSCPNPRSPGQVITIVYGVSPDAVAPVARLLFFYGWDSFLVFRNGRVVDRGTFEPASNPLEVQLDKI